MRRWLAMALAAGLLAVGLSGCAMEATTEKPVIYLYPEEETQVNVKLDYDGTLTSTYPSYENGWTVDAAPDGTLTDPSTGRQYYCLYWEGETDTEYDFSTGFCVAGADTAAFLEGALADLGLIYYLLAAQDGRERLESDFFPDYGLHRQRCAYHRPGA